MCSDCVDYNLEETESDLENKKIAYQLHHQQVFLDNEGYDEDQVCVRSSIIGHVSLRVPSKEEIDRVIVEMISQVHSNYNLRNTIVNNEIGKTFGIFIKDITHKMKDEDKKASVETVKVKDVKTKKWEPKKKVKFQVNEIEKEIVEEKGSRSDNSKQIVILAASKAPTLGMIVQTTMSEPIDMISMLSQITVKVPFSKLFRIEEHKSKVLSWLGGIRNINNNVE